MDPLQLLHKYFPDQKARTIVITHSRLVADKAVSIANRLGTPDIRFIEEAAMLHDIGVSRVHAPRIGCFGPNNYICHGILGRSILEDEGFPQHALACERHIGVGLTVEDILHQQLPLPHRDMTPVTLAEEIISFADLFYSKKPNEISKEKSVIEVRKNLARFGQAKVVIFDALLDKFSAGSNTIKLELGSCHFS
ncbi:HD domain-containing protein [Geobacter sp. DSM 9736]|uniref:HD domain-containing protein n=1 Tax=Geobacter sp. DSM 9736 TaxID=1277350 RepID=UPI000B504570|nr:HD domain-containing protein [Geobacter sp. DSM 9736]SNB45746.1 uncharacterized protein SAMN06269301_1174 [Geobacter sp. DSM 9736]